MIRKKKKNDPVVLDLNGPDGNAYVLMGYTLRLAKNLGLDGTAITKEMTTGDYENLLKVFDKYFGKYVILER